MIVSSDLIARDPRVSSRFNFSEKKTHSPRSFAALAFGLCDRQRESRVHDGRGGEGRGGERERALVLGFDSRRGDPGSLTLLIGEPSPRLVNRRALDRGSMSQSPAILRQPPLFLLRSSSRKRNRHRRADPRTDRAGDLSFPFVSFIISLSLKYRFAIRDEEKSCSIADF